MWEDTKHLYMKVGTPHLLSRAKLAGSNRLACRPMAAVQLPAAQGALAYRHVHASAHCQGLLSEWVEWRLLVSPGCRWTGLHPGECRKGTMAVRDSGSRLMSTTHMCKCKYMHCQWVFNSTTSWVQRGHFYDMYACADARTHDQMVKEHCTMPHAPLG